MKESVRKMDKYINLAKCMKVIVVPIVIGALGAISKNLANYPKELDIRKKKGRTAFLADKTTKLDITQNGKSIFPTLKHRHMTDNPIIIGRYDRLGTRSHLELRTRLVWARKQDLRENKTLEFWHSD